MIIKKKEDIKHKNIYDRPDSNAPSPPHRQVLRPLHHCHAIVENPEKLYPI